MLEDIRLECINGGNTNAIGHPSKLPIKLTTFSSESIVHTATSASIATNRLLITFRFVQNDRSDVDEPVSGLSNAQDFTVRHVISSEGKF